MIFRFREYVGPCIVKELASRLRDCGICAFAGTEHVYGSMSDDDDQNAYLRLNKYAGFQLLKTRIDLRPIDEDSNNC